MFKIEVQNRKYDLHRPRGCTVLAIEVEHWPGNEFGLWLPETVYSDEEIEWCNFRGDVKQTWQYAGGVWTWSKSLPGFSITSTLSADPTNRCLWYQHSFANHSEKDLPRLTSQTCFHLVNAPEFISIRGERIWACLDDKWMTTDGVPRQESPDPRRVSFLRKGIRTERTVVPSTGFPSAIMPEAACHPLFVAERFDGRASVAIACRNFKKLFNNNDCILRCLHSEPFPIDRLLPGQTAQQEGIILFSDAGHDEVRAHFEKLTAPRWAGEKT
jgi:hypothetical protein